MAKTLKTVLGTPLSLFQSRARLEVEIFALRHQLIVLRRTVPKRVRLRAVDRLLFVLLYRLWPSVLTSIAVIQPELQRQNQLPGKLDETSGMGVDCTWCWGSAMIRPNRVGRSADRRVFS